MREIITRYGSVVARDAICVGDVSSERGARGGVSAVRARSVGRVLSGPVRPDTGSSPVAGQQRVEILKALYRGARVLILDEPTAILAPREAEALRQQVLRLAEGGTAILWISHKLPEVMAFAQRVVVMRHGRVTAERHI